MNIEIRYFTKSKKGNTKKLADCVSKALEKEALTVDNDLNEKVDTLFLINAMYAYNVDKRIKKFLERNKDKIGTVYNINSSASGASTYKAVKKACDKYNINISDKEFHCRASWININKNRPNEEDFKNLEEFVLNIVNNN